MKLIDSTQIDKGQPIIVGVSGGADSMALLHLLDAEGYDPVIAHCNFHLRGAESDRDEEFVRHVATTMYGRRRLEVIGFDTLGYVAKHKVSVEMAARRLRYDWFRTLCTRHSASIIAVAHHADDQIETLLLNLSRGTGGEGLVGMKSLHEGIWRPLLETSRREILGYLEEHNLAYVEDSTNVDTTYRRNLIRHELIPLFERLNPSFRSSALRSIGLFGKEQTLIRTALSEWIDDNYDIDTKSITLSDTPHAELLLYRYLSPMGFSADQISDLHGQRERSGAIFASTDGEMMIERFRGRAYMIDTPLIPIPQQISLSTPVYPFGEVGQVTIGDEGGALRISRSLLSRDLTLRCADKRDRIQVFGQKSGSRLLFDLLKDKGIPASYRPYVPVLAEGNMVHAVIPLQISETARVMEGDSPLYIRLDAGSSPLASILIKSAPDPKR